MSSDVNDKLSFHIISLVVETKIYSIYSRLEEEDYAAKEPTILPIKQTLTNGSSHQLSPKKMLYPVKTMGSSMLANHQSNALKSNGNINTHIPSTDKIISTSRRIPRLIRSANVDDHNNNLLNDISSYKNGMNGCNNNGTTVSNGKDSHTKLISSPIDLQNGELNGKSTKLVRIKNASILKSPNFRTRVTSADE